MFTKILWATDGSQPSDQALPFVRAVATLNSSTVEVLHCRQPLVGSSPYGHPIYTDEEELIEKIRAQGDALREDAVPTTVEVVPARSMSGIAHDIDAAATKAGADLIVVGTRGHTALGGLLLGSVTQRLLHVAHCPVLVIPVTAEVSDDQEPAGSVAAQA